MYNHSDSFFIGPVFGNGNGNKSSWIDTYIVPHALWGYVIYYICNVFIQWVKPSMARTKQKKIAFVVAFILHLLYEIKDQMAYYGVEWANKFSDLYYNNIITKYLEVDISTNENTPMNSVFDQLAATLGIYICYRWGVGSVKTRKQRFWVVLSLLIISLIICGFTYSPIYEKL